MRPHRLERLRLLTQGAALLGMGGQIGCHDAPEPVHINAPYVVYDAGSTARVPPVMNAPEFVNPDAGAGAAPVASDAGTSASPPASTSSVKALAAPSKAEKAPLKRESTPKAQ